MKKLLLIATFFGLASWARGQDFTKPDPTIQTVTLDLANYSIKDFGLLPFDDAVQFIGLLSDTLNVNLHPDKIFYLCYKVGRCPNYSPKNAPMPIQGPDAPYEFGGYGYIPSSNIFGNAGQLYMYFAQIATKVKHSTNISYLKFKHFEPNTKYCLQITQDQASAEDSNYPYSVKINAHTASSFSDVVKLDIGLAYAFNNKTTFGVVSGHLYFSPINDDADIKNIVGDRHWFWKRFSVFACIAPFVVVSGASQEVKPLANLGNFGFGFGWRSPFYGYSPYHNEKKVYQIGRIFQPLRINVGVMHYAQVNPNPVITKTTSKWSPTISITYSFGVAAILGPLAKLFS